MKIGKNKLKMSSGEVRTFKSNSKRDKFEKMAQWYKHNQSSFKKAMSGKGLGIPK